MRHPAYRLDHDAARAMRRNHAAGHPVRALARDHGVSLPTVRAVLRYDRYDPALSPNQQSALAEAARRLGRTRDETLDAVFAHGLANLGAGGRSPHRLRELVTLLRVLLDQFDAARQDETTIEYRVWRALEEFDAAGDPVAGMIQPQE